MRVRIELSESGKKELFTLWSHMDEEILAFLKAPVKIMEPSMTSVLG